MKKHRIKKITVTYAHEKNCICSQCDKNIQKGTPYFIFNLSEGKLDYIDTKISLCKECLDEAIKDYKDKEGNYGNWLKRRIVKHL